MTRTCQGCGQVIPPSRGGPPRKWCSERCRKRQYGDPCVDCGARTVFGAEHARIPEPRCRVCAGARRRGWTRELILERIREWASIYGEPPAVTDWDQWSTRHRLHDEKRALRFEEGDWPHFVTAVRLFGSWNAAINAAGFEGRANHGGGGNQSRRRKAAA